MSGGERGEGKGGNNLGPSVRIVGVIGGFPHHVGVQV